MKWRRWSPPPRRRYRLSLVIPSSIVRTEPTLQLKSLKLSLIARAAGIYRVDEVVVYRDPDSSSRDLAIVRDILEYLVTPPYIRKLVIPIKRTLLGVGVVPPLKVPSHVVSQPPSPGEYRCGLVVKRGRRLFVDVGLRDLVRLEQVKGVKPGDLVVVRLDYRTRGLVAVIDKPPFYWGFKVVTASSLGEALKRVKGLKVATSRLGADVRPLLGELSRRIKEVDWVALVFGSPYKGLYEIAEAEGLHLEGLVDYVVNLVPDQGVETIRTEEAVLAALQTLTLINSDHLTTTSG